MFFLDVLLLFGFTEKKAEKDDADDDDDDDDDAEEDGFELLALVLFEVKGAKTSSRGEMHDVSSLT